MASPWTIDELRQLAADGAEIGFFDKRGARMSPPPALADHLGPNRHVRVETNIDRVHEPDRAGVVRAHQGALVRPGTVHETEMRVHLDGRWSRLRARFGNAFDEPGLGALIRVVEYLELLPDFDAIPDRSAEWGSKVPWVKMRCDVGASVLAVEGMPEALYGLSAGDLVGRNAIDFIHPDDLAIVIDGSMRATDGPDHTVTVTHRLCRADGSTVLVEATLGLPEEHGADWDVYLRDAERAMRQELTEGLEGNQLFLVYQPVVEVGTGAMMGAEALVRWVHPTRGLVPPLDFIPVAESSGVIVELGAWVLRTACVEAATWPGHLHVAVNLSVRQLGDQGIVALVAEALAASGLPADRLVLEVTESALMDNADRAISHLRQLKELGARIAIDDFGTGYSSLQYLKRMPVDVLKIDRSFVDGLGDDRGDTAIVTSVVALAHAFGLEVVAEGVETERQHDYLVQLGCDSAQGFLWSRPAPADQFQALIDRPLAVSDTARVLGGA